MSGEIEAEYGSIGGRGMYYEQQGGRLDIFPDGLPDHRPHDHMVVENGNAVYYRENGQVIVDNR